MQTRLFVSLPLILVSLAVYGQDQKGSLVFEKHPIASEAFESVNVLDVDKDGVPDLLIGAEDGFFYLHRNPRSR